MKLSLTLCPSHNLEKIPTFLLITVVYSKGYIVAICMPLYNYLYEDPNWREIENDKHRQELIG